MGEHRHRPVHRIVDLDLPRRVGEMVDTAQYMADAHVVIVDDDGQIIGRRAVAAQDDEIIEVFVLEDDAALDLVVNDGFALVRGLQADGRLDAWRMQLEGSGVAVHVTFIPYRGSTWRVTGFSRSIDAKKYRPHILNTARSFRPLTAEERSSIETTRLSIVTAHAGEDLAELCRRTGNAWDASRTAVLNGIFANHRFDGGEFVKIARVEPYVPGKP